MSLGCASSYTASIYTRGGKTFVMSIDGPTEIHWSRTNNATSTASCVIDGASADCCAGLGSVDPFAHELRIDRDGVLVWQGPVVTMEYEFDKVTINAADLSVWLDRRRVLNKFVRESILPEQWARKMIEQAIMRDNSMYLTYSIWSSSVGGGIDRMIRAKEFKTVASELSDLANTWIDWWVIDRVIYLAGYMFVGASASVNDSHFDEVGTITVSGEQIGNDYVVQGRGRGSAGVEKYGYSGDLGSGSYLGLHMRVLSDDNLHKVEQLDGKASSLANKYNRLTHTFSGGTLGPTFPLGVNSITPGVVLSVSLSETCRSVSGSFRIENVKCDVNDEGETLSIEVQRLGAG